MTCTSILRTLPGRRQVYDAVWNDSNVILKIFTHRFSKHRHLKRDWKGLVRLQSRELNSPAPLFYGKTEQGCWVVVTEKIQDSSTVLDTFNKLTHWSEKLNLLLILCREIARQHNKGVLQKDLHMGNFLLQRNKIFALDPGQMRFSKSPLRRKISLRQLASLACSLPENQIEAVSRLYEEYCLTRGWQHSVAERELFQEMINRHRKNMIRKSLKKCMRTSKRYQRIKFDRWLTVIKKDFCDGLDTSEFVPQIDVMMDKGQILKKGNTAYVSRIKFNDKDVVVKRYNHKGLFHSFRQTLKRSRARRSWLHSYRLRALEIPTANPLAFIEYRCAGLVLKSYFISEFVEGQNLGQLLRNNTAADKNYKEILNQVEQLAGKMCRHRIVHHDLKPSNILITKTSPVLMDMDAIKIYKSNWLCKIRYSKSLKRLRRNKK